MNEEKHDSIKAADVYVNAHREKIERYELEEKALKRQANPKRDWLFLIVGTLLGVLGTLLVEYLKANHKVGL